MTGRFEFKTLAKYPHMKPEDVAVWERFITKNPGYFDSVDYDFPVGEGAPTSPDHPPEIQYDHKILTQKKIDAVGYRGNTVTIIEVKPIADMKALGQALTYSHLYAIDHAEATDIQRMVVAGSIERELEGIYTQHDVQIELA